MPKAKTKAERLRSKPSKPPVTAEEKQAIRARKLVEHDHMIRKDEFGRDRLVRGADQRQFDIGSMKSVVRVRNVDPLAGIMSLTWQQRKAGARYRADFETCEREGLKTGSWDMRVDGGGGEKDRPQRIVDAHTDIAKANEALGYGEIRRVIQHVCGHGLSIKAMAEVDRIPRDVVSMLLVMGLHRLTMHYGIVPHPK
jgi:hypothetical protein